MNRRNFLHLAAAAAAALAPSSSGAAEPAGLAIDPKPLHELSPHLYMQFMEPLGVTDGSVEAAWDHTRNAWRQDLVEVTRELAPGMLRWGGLFSAYYRWKEGVGPRAARKRMLNLQWGGTETNQVGTAEFLEFCKAVAADPLLCVNFESEGDRNWAMNPRGEVRSADAQEAADWVSYCNNPGNRDRIAHGLRDLPPVKFWQIGNETSYGRNRFNQDTAIAKTIEFARAMRRADAGIQIIAWGDSGWAPKMLERAAEHINLLAFHHLFDPGRGLRDSPLPDGRYYKDPAATWQVLIDAVKIHEKAVLAMRQHVQPAEFPMALTECHFVIPGRDRGDVNSTWAAGAAYARFLNLHQRHGDLLKIANLADFCGTRWQTNAVMLPVPQGRAYMMPVAKVMALYRNHSGKRFVATTGAPADVDVVASRTDKTLFVHAVNTNRTKAIDLPITATGLTIKSGRMFVIAAPTDAEIMNAADDPMKVQERPLTPATPVNLPAAAVAAIELTVE